VLFAVKGSVTTIGHSEYNNNAQNFAYIEITEPSGRRVMIEKVVVSNHIGAIFAMGVTGEFFVDRVFQSGQVRCQLWVSKRTTERYSIAKIFAGKSVCSS
jgi:hypothetical protein